MADLADIASDFMDNQLAREVEKVRSHIKNHIGPQCCIECDSEIPMGRRQLGFERCIHCAEELERHGALFAEA